MNDSEKEIYEINIQNVASSVAAEYSDEVVTSVFERYGASRLHDLAPAYYGEVFADLEMIAADN